MSTLKRLHAQTRSRRQGKPAFTLLELIVVLLVLGILAAIAVPTFNTVKQNSAAGTFQATAEAIARNANAIATSSAAAETTMGDVEDAVAEVEGITEDGGAVSGSVGTYNCAATIAIVNGLAEVASDANCDLNGSGGDASAFQAQTTVWSWANWDGDVVTTVPASSVCGTLLPVTPHTYGTDPELDSFGPIVGWEYSIDGAAFSQWAPTQTNNAIFGGTQPGLILFYGLDGDFGAPEDPSAIAMCALTSGQQVQFKTPSGLYSPILTIA